MAVTANGSVVSTYINGILLTTHSNAQPPNVDPTTPLLIGGGGSASFPGRVDEIRISSVVRTPAEFCLDAPCVSDAGTVAIWHLDEGTGVIAFDSSANGNHGTLLGATWTCPTVPVDVTLHPRRLKLSSMGNFVTAYLTAIAAKIIRPLS